MNARRLSVWLAAAFVAHTTFAANTNEPLARTVSVTGQFVSYATNPELPPAVCVFAERVNTAWRDRLNILTQWRDPIVIVVRSRDAATTNAATLSIEMFQTESHLKYQITCFIPPPIDEERLIVAIVEALCAETANHDQSTHRDQPYIAAPIPLWLSCGLAQFVVGRPELLLDAARRSVRAGRPQSAAELMTVTTLPGEPAVRELFQANAWLLTEALLSQPDGSRKMQRFLSVLGATKSLSNAFESVYRDAFPRPVALEKWWSVERMSRISTVVAANLSLDETASQLDGIVVTTLAHPASKRGAEVRADVPLAQLWRYYEQPWLKPLLTDKLNRLSTLRSQAHPLYHPVIDEYCAALQLLVGQQLNRFRRAVATADRARVSVDRTRQQISQYLDRSEHTYAPEELAGTFRGYFRTLDQFEALERQRSTPIGDYLDKLDY